jgi:predicted RNase H-like HicB family nuclease
MGQRRILDLFDQDESFGLFWADTRDSVAQGTYGTATVRKRLCLSHASIGSYMELAIDIRIESLPEGPYLATSDELPGLVAQGRTVAETLEIARDVAKKLIEARREREDVPILPTIADRDHYTIVVGG